MLTEYFLPCACYAASATVFYKKNIRKDGLPVVLLLATLGYGIEHSTLVLFSSLVIATLLYAFGRISIEWLVSAAKLDVFLAFFVAIVDVKYNVIESVIGFARDIDIDERTSLHEPPLSVIRNDSVTNPLSNGANVTSVILDVPKSATTTAVVFEKEYVICIGIIRHLWCEMLKVVRPINWPKIRIILISLPQFLRKPISLKAKLQGARAKLGPIYVMYVVNYAFRFYQDVPNEGLLCMCWMIVAMAAFFAGVFTRPDNSTTCDLVHFPSSYSCRKKCHKYLMISTFLFCLLVFGYERFVL